MTKNLNNNIFGIPSKYEDSTIIYIPVPWEATTSYGGGTAKGPNAINKASVQLDLYDCDVDKPFEQGLYLLSEDKDIVQWNEISKNLVTHVIQSLDRGTDDTDETREHQKQVNHYSQKINKYVYEKSKEILQDNKIVSVIGGDHSVPLGAFKAIGENYPSFGILHFDAHCDSRNAYQGFEYSHASIMYNALEEIPNLTKLVQVGIRDFCEEELNYNKSQGGRVISYFDSYLQNEKFTGKNWDKTCHEIIQNLPDNVWVSFDIDGLDPYLCPNTGTPVPGGLSFQEASHLLKTLAHSGKKIIGFDLCEVSPGNNEWDANVGMRLLYKLSAWTLLSQGKAKANTINP